MSPRSSGGPDEPRGIVVVVPTSIGGPPGVLVLVVSGRGGSIVGEPAFDPVVDPVEGDVAGGPPGVLDVVVSGRGGSIVGEPVVGPVGEPAVGPVVDRVGGDVIGSPVGGSDVEPAGSGTVPIVVGVLSCCSRSCSSTSPGVIGAGRATLTSRATRSTAALTPNTIKAVVTTQVTEIRSTGPMKQVCDRLLPLGVKPW